MHVAQILREIEDVSGRERAAERELAVCFGAARGRERVEAYGVGAEADIGFELSQSCAERGESDLAVAHAHAPREQRMTPRAREVERDGADPRWT